jgi:hypothetical protein
MSAALVIHDELSGFHPGNQGSAVVLYESPGEAVTITTKYAVPFEDDADGWDWGLGGTRLNVLDITNLRDYLNGVLTKIGA